MKRLGLFLYLGFIAALLSCTKESNPLPSDSGREVELTVRADMGQTRATEADFNDEVESMQVFVFSGGRLETVGYTACDSVTLRCFEGYKNIYAVVNHPEIEWTPDMADEDLLETVVELKDNMNVMFGYAINRGLSADGTLWGTLPSTMMSINVKRVAARIVLRSVKNSTGGTLTVTRAYITNVVGDADFHAVYSSSDCTWEPAIWYNRMGIERGLDMGSDLGDLEGILCSEEMSVSVWKKLKENINEYFYCFPNPTEKDYRLLYGMEGWCSRFTRLVVKAEYNDVPYYYVVSIGGIQNNHSYEVELEITGSGASDEEGGYKSDDDEGEGSGDDGDDESGDTGGSIGDGHFKDGDETGGGGGKGENSVSAGNCDGVAAIRFIGGSAEVREL